MKAPKPINAREQAQRERQMRAAEIGGTSFILQRETSAGWASMGGGKRRRVGKKPG